MTERFWALRAQAWLTIGLAGLLSAFVYLQGSTLTRAIVLIAAYGVATLVLARRLYAERRGDWLPWLLLLLVLGFWFVAWIFWQTEILQSGITPPITSWINLVFLAGNATLVPALGLLLIRREPDLVAGLDAAIVATALLMVAWMLLISGYVSDTTLPLLGRGVQITYALTDVLVLALLVRLLVSPGRRSPALAMTLAGASGLLFSDGVWNWSTQLGSYLPGSWADLGWLLSAAVFGAAAAHPAARSIYQRGPSPDRRVSWTRMAPLAAALLTPALILAVNVESSRIDDLAVSLASATLGLLVLARVGLILLNQSRFAKLDAIKDTFVASVSHELRTPLTSIRGYLELVLDSESDPLTDEQTQYLQIVERNSDRLLRLVGDILDVAQAEGGIPLKVVPCDIGALARQAVERARPAADAKGIDLVVDARAAASVPGDEFRLAQTLDNLISNAIKFTPPRGDVVVSVTEDAGFAIIKVADTGMGIGAADQKQLFQRFFRTDEATSKAIAGTGLGLWITKSIVEAHKGRLTVESEKGVGTTFQIDLPKQTPPPVEPSRPTRRMRSRSPRSLSPARSH
ncbi:MAG: hypothetical protein QOG21_314 [Actinomycetota bacterium]|jgi:signal transduction histidine kinase|nr:hypothetical protein [Actinomycetota bacterium]